MKNYEKAEEQIVELIDLLSGVDHKTFESTIGLSNLITALRLLHVYVVGAELDQKYDQQ